MYKSLYRTYRPEVFGEVIGQEHIVRILGNQLKAGEINHAYLFCGTRGTGKTTIARLLAKAVNCTSTDEIPCGHCANCQAIKNGSFMDLIEIDAASNNGVENIRELRESVKYPPVAGSKKVYIMDEVHMLSQGAFNALLKTLEEPPKDVMFILCTTEPEKLPATVLSRCIRMDFKRVLEAQLVSRMKKICDDKGIQVDESGLMLIAANADGSVRDGLSILEQCISGRQDRVSREDIIEAIGTVGEEFFIEITEAVKNGDVSNGLMLIEEMLEKGRDSRQIISGWMAHFRNLLMIKYIDNPENIISMSMENIERMRYQCDTISLDMIDRSIRELSQCMFDAKRSSQPRVLLEMVYVKLASGDAFGAGYAGTMGNEAVHPFIKTSPVQKENSSAMNSVTPAMQQGVATRPVAIDECSSEVDGSGAPGLGFENDAKIQGNDQNSQSAQGHINTQVAGETQVDGSAQVDKEAEEMAQLEKLWETFLARGEQEVGGNFFLIRAKAIPLYISDNCLFVRAKGIAKDIIEKYPEQMNSILSDIKGNNFVIRVKDEVDQEETQKQADHFDSMASAASEILGMQVEIKD